MATEKRRNWDRLEVEATVADYFHMLKLELSGQAYNKAEHRRALSQKLNKRSDLAIDRKHMNISAILRDVDSFWIPGFKPLEHYQDLLGSVVLQHIQTDKTFDQAALQAAEAIALPPVSFDPHSVLVDPPRFERRTAVAGNAYRSNPHLYQRDYLERESMNRSLGSAGEEFVLRYETSRLSILGYEKLAKRVEHVSTTIGDGLGYDILSFETNGEPRFVEVKTTRYAKETPFFLSKNELSFSQSEKTRYFLYRVFDFRTTPKLFSLNGPIDNYCNLDPISFRVSFA